MSFVFGYNFLKNESGRVGTAHHKTSLKWHNNAGV